LLSISCSALLVVLFSGDAFEDMIAGFDLVVHFTTGLVC